MKRQYSKPEIQFEDFSLSVNIAAVCEVEAPHARNVCGYTMSDDFDSVVIFVDGVQQCIGTGLVPDGTAADGLCYNVPTTSYNVFGS